MKKTNAFNVIDSILTNESETYLVDFVPFTFPNEDYFELEKFLQKSYKAKYAEKVVFIAFTLMYYYDCSVFLDNDVEESIFSDLLNKDLRKIGLNKLEDIIKTIIIEDYSALNIIMKHDDTYSLMRIEDGYQTLFFNISGKDLRIIKELVNHQGLFFKKVEW